VSQTTNAPAGLAFPQLLRPDNAFHVRVQGTYREAFRFTEMGECVLIGRDIAPDLRAMRGFAGWLILAGSGVLVLGGSGGWMFVSRALRPVSVISKAAGWITEGDLSRRIEIAEPDSELGHLATNLNSTFARLETAFQQQRQFTSDVSHELWTPLAIMISEAQTTLARERDADEYRETIVNCLDTAQQMRRLTELLLQLARFDAGQRSIERQPVDLAEVTRREIKRIETLAAGKQVTIESTLNPGPTFGDESQLAQVVINLLTNAFYYNKPGVRVIVSTDRDERNAVITVSGTGVGIAPEDVPHLFERFYRADKSRSRSEGHAGLGMAIAKSIVDAHGGCIGVTSTSGVGSEFTVRLP